MTIDGGYAWVIVACSFTLQVLAVGVAYTFGVLYVELLNIFNQDKSTTAWIGSFQTFFTYFSGTE